MNKGLVQHDQPIKEFRRTFAYFLSDDIEMALWSELLDLIRLNDLDIANWLKEHIYD
jgi:hypothetical protein